MSFVRREQGEGERGRGGAGERGRWGEGERGEGRGESTKEDFEFSFL